MLKKIIDISNVAAEIEIAAENSKVCQEDLMMGYFGYTEDTAIVYEHDLAEIKNRIVGDYLHIVLGKAKELLGLIEEAAAEAKEARGIKS